MLNIILRFMLITMLVLQGGSFSVGHAHAQQAKKEYTIAVLKLDSKQISEAEGQELTGRFMNAVFQLISSEQYRSSGKVQYSMVERADMDKILEQYNVQNSGCVSDSCAIALGKMLQADRIAFGTAAYSGNSYSLSVRIVDVESSRVLALASERFSGSFNRLLDRGVIDITDKLFGMQKKSKKKWYILAGAVVLGAGAGAAMMGGSGGGTSKVVLPDPPDMP